MLRTLTQLFAAPPLTDALETLQLTGSPVSALLALFGPPLLRFASPAREN